MEAIHDRYVDVGGLKLHYRESGSPDGVPVVALHGHPSTASTWDGLASGLTASGRYRLLALTQRGYGLSARSPVYSLEALRDDVFGFADALGLGPFVLVGHSMGATVATLVAELDVDRLVELVLVDAVPPPEGMGFPIPRRPDGELPYDWAVVPAVFRQLASPDPAWWARMPRITVPTLLIGGGSTSHVPQRLLVEAAERIPAARLVTLEGAGHRVHVAEPERFLAEVSGFLDRVVPV